MADLGGLVESFEQEEANESHVGLIVLVVLLIVILVGGLATGIYFLVRWQTRKKSQKTRPKPPTIVPPLAPNGQGAGALRPVVYLPRLAEQPEAPLDTPAAMDTDVDSMDIVAAPLTLPFWEGVPVFAPTPQEDGIDVIYVPGAAPPLPPPVPVLPPTTPTTPNTPKTPKIPPKTKPAPAASMPSGGTAWNDALPLPNPAPLRKNVAPWYITNISNEKAMSSQDGGIRFAYKKGVAGGKGGGSFKANPNKSLPAEGCVLSYDVFFPPGFQWVKGGKLPGVCIGTKPDECANGKEWTATAGSVRVNFKDDGAAAAYVYLALPGGSDGAYAAQGSNYKDAADIGKRSGEDNAPGHHIWLKKSGGLRFKSGEFNSVRLHVTLNTPGLKNGSLSLTVNGETRSLTDVVFRTSASVRINAVNFVSFFGGKVPSPVDTFSVIKNVRFGVSTR